MTEVLIWVLCLTLGIFAFGFAMEFEKTGGGKWCTVAVFLLVIMIAVARYL